jgi:hypothetical protein
MLTLLAALESPSLDSHFDDDPRRGTRVSQTPRRRQQCGANIVDANNCVSKLPSFSLPSFSLPLSRWTVAGTRPLLCYSIAGRAMVRLRPEEAISGP